MSSNYFPQELTSASVPSDDNTFLEWYLIFKNIVFYLFPETRVAGIQKNKKVLRPTIQEIKIQVAKMLERMFPGEFRSVSELPPLEFTPMQMPIYIRRRLLQASALPLRTGRCSDKVLKNSLLKYLFYKSHIYFSKRLVYLYF
jgi:hypothetical protein